MSLKKSFVRKFNKKISKILKESGVRPERMSVCSHFLSTFSFIVMTDDRIDSFKTLHDVLYYSKLIQEFNVIDVPVSSSEIHYKFLSEMDVAPYGNLINNKKFINFYKRYSNEDGFDKNFDKNFKKLLNNLVYLFIQFLKHKPVNNYKEITEEDKLIFIDLLELEKKVQISIASLFPKHSNEIVVFINNLLLIF